MLTLKSKNTQAVNQYSIWQRMMQMMIGWGTVGLIYFSLGWREVEAIILPELWLDKQIAFTANGIWLYLSFFIFIPYTYLTVAADRLLRLRYTMQISALISGVVFLVLPSEFIYPEIIGEGVSVELLRFLTANDSPQNCLPSLHAALSFICVIALWEKQQLIKSILIALVGAAICFSIIQLRRHLTIDVSAGFIVGLLSYYLAMVIYLPAAIYFPKPIKKLHETVKRILL